MCRVKLARLAELNAGGGDPSGGESSPPAPAACQRLLPLAEPLVSWLRSPLLLPPLLPLPSVAPPSKSLPRRLVSSLPVSTRTSVGRSQPTSLESCAATEFLWEYGVFLAPSDQHVTEWIGHGGVLRLGLIHLNQRPEAALEAKAYRRFRVQFTTVPDGKAQDTIVEANGEDHASRIVKRDFPGAVVTRVFDAPPVSSMRPMSAIDELEYEIKELKNDIEQLKKDVE